MYKSRSKKKDLNFINKLIKHCIQLKKLKPRQVCIFNVFTKHGNYQVYIGPECVGTECKKMHVKPHSRKLEINGSMYHLFVNPKHISADPQQEDLRSNLRGSVIMRDIAIHIVDQDGSGAHIQIEDVQSSSMIEEGHKINLAGEKGDHMLERFRSSGKLMKETYKIIQEDILEAIKENLAKSV